MGFLTSCERISTACDRQHWLELRKSGIGGSDAAAVLGLNPYSSPYAVWADKTGRLPEREDTEAMRQGRDLEDYVAKRFCENTDKRVRRTNYMYRSLKHPFALANLDRLVIGEYAGLECKTTSVLNLKTFKTGDYPDTYYVQCMHYMAVTGAARWYLAVLVLNQGFYTYIIERDEAEIAALMQEEQHFWDSYVKTDTPPPMDGYPATTEAIKAMYPGGDTKPLTLFGREALLEQYFEHKAKEKGIQTAIEEIKQTLMQDMGNAEAGRDHPAELSGSYDDRRPIGC